MVRRFGAGAPTLERVAEIKKGRLGAGVSRAQIEQARQPAKIKEEVEKTIQQIKSEQITSASQIPFELRQYINVPEGYFEYHQQQRDIETGITDAVNKLKYYQQQQRLASDRNDHRRADKYTEYVIAWTEGVKKVKEGYTYDSVRKWVSATAGGEVARELEREEQLQQIDKEIVSKISGIEKTQYEAFRRGGYSPSEASRLTEWSTKYQMSPTKETEKRILKGEDVSPYVKPKVTLTPKERLIEKLRGREVLGDASLLRGVEVLGGMSLFGLGDEPSTEIFQIQKQSYQRQGFTEEQSELLARESVSEQVTFTKREAEKRLVEGEKPSGVLQFITGSPYVPIFSVGIIGGAGTPKGLTITEFKEAVGTYGDIPKGIVGIVPETRLGLGVTTAFIGVYGFLPKVARLGVSTGIVGLEIPKVISPETPKSEKITAGIIGGMATVGTVFEGMPFLRGVKAQTIGRLTGEYKPMKIQPEGFKAIVKIKETRIGLIPAGKGVSDIMLPKISPLRRGAFGVRPSEKRLFLGEQTIATSQIGLFKIGKEISLERPFYVSPQEPFLKIPITRESRLGIEKPFEFPRGAEIGFGLPKPSQIGISQIMVKRIETPTTFVIGKGTELEAIKTFGTIKGVERIGVTTVRGQAVDIFKFEIGRGKRIGKGLPKDITTKKITHISGEATISTGLSIRTISITKPISTIPIPTIKMPTSTTFILPPTKTISVISPPKMLPSYPPISPPRMPPYSPPSKPPYSPHYTPPYSPPSYPPISPPRMPPSYPPRTPYRPSRIKGRKAPTGKFLVEVRRYGKFKPIGSFADLKRAFSVGRERVAGTLAATFRVTPRDKGRGIGMVKIPKGFYQKKGAEKPLTFIEKRKHRLSLPSEIREIQLAKLKLPQLKL